MNTKGFKALNKIVALLATVSMLCSFLPSIPFAAETENEASLMKVEGSIESRQSGREVSIDVFAEGKTPLDIVEGVSMKDVIVYHGQTTSGINGAYSFEFEVPDPYAAYTAYIGTEDSDEVEVKTLIITDQIKLRIKTSDAAGNIFTDSNPPSFKMQIRNNSSSSISLSLKAEALESGTTASSQTKQVTVLAKGEETVDIVFDDLRYGIFDLKAMLSTVDGQLCDTAETRFSKIKTPSDGQKNQKLGVTITEDAALSQDGATEVLDKLGAGNIYIEDIAATAEQAVSGSIAVAISSAQVGHIYYDNKNTEFDVTLTNNSGTEFSGKLLYNVVGVSKAEACNVELAAGESTQVKINTATNSFGIFELQAEVADLSGNVITRTNPTRFSVVNAPPEGVVNRKLGTNLSIRPQNTHMGDPMINLQLASRIGLGFFRVEVSMGQYDQTHDEGVTGLSQKHQELFNYLKEKGLTATVILGYGQITDEDYIERMNAYAASLATDPLVNDVTHQYQLLNEPDLEFRNWPAERYVEVLKALYPVLTTADPQAFLWGPATASMSPQNEWVKTFFAQGGGSYVHGFDVHRYSLTSTPEAGAIETYFKNYRELMTKYGHGNKPIYLSEHGWSSTGENGYANELQQAAYSVRTQFSGDYFDMWDQYASYCFNDGGIENEKEQRFGMVKARNSEIPYEAKPLYLAYANYNALMIGAQFVERADLSTDVPVYRYTLADGRDAAVLWSVSGNNSINLSLDTKCVEIYDMYGNKRTLYNEDGNFEVSLSEEPIYITGDFGRLEKASAQTKSFAEKLAEIGITLKNDKPQKTDSSSFEFIRSMLDGAAAEGEVWSDLEAVALNKNVGLVKSRFSEIPYEAKPLYVALAAYNSILGDAVFKSKTGISGGVLYSFDKDGKTVYALCGSGDTCTVSLDVVRSILVYDVYGNETQIFSQNGEFEIPSDNSPVYFEAGEESISILRNGSAVTDVSQLVSGDKVSVKVKPEIIGKDAYVYAAGYAGGAMKCLAAKNVSAEEFAQDGALLELTIPQVVDTFCVYIWDNAMAPVTTPFKLGGNSR